MRFCLNHLEHAGIYRGLFYPREYSENFSIYTIILQSNIIKSKIKTKAIKNRKFKVITLFVVLLSNENYKCTKFFSYNQISKRQVKNCCVRFGPCVNNFIFENRISREQFVLCVNCFLKAYVNLKYSKPLWIWESLFR